LPSKQSHAAAHAPGNPTEAKGNDQKKIKAVKSTAKRVFFFFRDDQPPRSQQIDEHDAHIQMVRMGRLIHRQSTLIVGLIILVIMLVPLLHPIQNYKARNPEGKNVDLVPLMEPNQTDQAILSWAATTITEVMTFGFGDIDTRILAQKSRFTNEGWDSFVEAFRKQRTREGFKQSQLVLTTVPTDVPVITKKGVDKDGDYQWVVEMPVIMTHTTNDRATSVKKSAIRLTIVKVPPSHNVRGIGIKLWYQK
jgi:intracellular multiplication protein IcmL